MASSSIQTWPISTTDDVFTTTDFSETTTKVYNETKPSPNPVVSTPPPKTIQIVVPIVVVVVLILVLLVIIILIRKGKIPCLKSCAQQSKETDGDYLDMTVAKPGSPPHRNEGDGAESGAHYYSNTGPAEQAQTSDRLYQNMQSDERDTRVNQTSGDGPSEYSEVFTPPTADAANAYESLQHTDKKGEENRAYEALGSEYQNTQFVHRPQEENSYDVI